MTNENNNIKIMTNKIINKNENENDKKQNDNINDLENNLEIDSENDFENDSENDFENDFNEFNSYYDELISENKIINNVDNYINELKNNYKYKNNFENKNEKENNLIIENDLDLKKIQEEADSLSNKKINPILKLQKMYLRSHIQKKVQKLNLKQRYIEDKLSKTKNINTRFIVATILISSLLTLIESANNIFNVENNVYNYIPLLLSTLVTICSAFSKTFKYQEKIEELIKCLEKCILTEAELKKTREQLHFCNNYHLFFKIKDNYLVNNYAMYISCTMDINKNISSKHVSKHIKDINNIDIKIKEECLKKEESIVNINKKIENLNKINNSYDENILNEIKLDKSI